MRQEQKIDLQVYNALCKKWAKNLDDLSTYNNNVVKISLAQNFEITVLKSKLHITLHILTDNIVAFNKLFFFTDLYFIL